MTPELALFACTVLRMIHKLFQIKKKLCFWADASPLSFQLSNQSSLDKIKPRCFFLISLANMSNGLWLVDFGRFENRINALFLTERLKSAVWVACFHFFDMQILVLIRCWRRVTNYPCIYIHAWGISTVNALLCHQELLHNDVLMTSTRKYWPLQPGVYSRKHG